MQYLYASTLSIECYSQVIAPRQFVASYKSQQLLTELEISIQQAENDREYSKFTI